MQKKKGLDFAKSANKKVTQNTQKRERSPLESKQCFARRKMQPDSPDLTPLLDTVFKPTPTPYLDELTRIAKRWEEIDKQEEGNGYKNREKARCAGSD